MFHVNDRLVLLSSRCPGAERRGLHGVARLRAQHRRLGVVVAPCHFPGRRPGRIRGLRVSRRKREPSRRQGQRQQGEGPETFHRLFLSASTSHPSGRSKSSSSTAKTSRCPLLVSF